MIFFINFTFILLSYCVKICFVVLDRECVIYMYIAFQFGFGSVSLFNGISTLFRLFNAKAILLEEQ